jgi:hypothetical protein
MEAARAMDERRSGEGAGGGGAHLDFGFDDGAPATIASSPSDVTESAHLRRAAPVPEKDAQIIEFESAFDAGIDALLAKDHRAAACAFERALVLCPGDAKVRANLARLEALGFRTSSGGHER